MSKNFINFSIKKVDFQRNNSALLYSASFAVKNSFRNQNSYIVGHKGNITKHTKGYNYLTLCSL